MIKRTLFYEVMVNIDTLSKQPCYKKYFTCLDLTAQAI